MKKFFQRKWDFKLLVMVVCVFFLLIACSQVLDPTSIDEVASAPVSGSPSIPASAPSEPVGSPSAPASAPSEPVGSPSTPASAPSESADSPSAPVNPPFEPSNAELSDYQYNKMQVISSDNSYLKNVLWGQKDEDIPKVLHLLQILRDEIVPQSVNKLMATFPKTFGWMKEYYEVGMGVVLNPTSDDSVVAAFSANDARGNTPDEAVDMEYGLMVKYNDFVWNEDGSLTEISRSELESHIIHEMMHALMCESLTCGYMGRSSELEDLKHDTFPIWFREGTAEAAGGGTGIIWKEITKTLFLKNGMEEKYIEDFLKKYPLDGESSQSRYRTGYFATMYLGYLASGKKSMEPQDIAAGLDLLLYKIHCGQSLASVIKDISPVLENGEKKYSDIDSFVSGFTDKNTEIVTFVTNLMNKATATGRGSLLASSFTDSNLLPDEKFETSLFWLYLGRDVYWNKYGETMSARQMFKGGSATKDGVSGLGAQR